MRSGSGFQFAHVDWSAKVGAKKTRTSLKNNSTKTRDTSWSASEISDEAMRVDGACQHVENPQPPTLLYGVMPDVAVQRAEAWAASKACEVQTKNGVKLRAYRADAPIMSNGVISFPAERMEDWPAFRDASISWLKKRYGHRFLSAIEHLDEAHPHLHFYCVPTIGEDFDTVHEGYAARRTARGGDNKVRAAFQGAMKSWQDDFYNDVSSKFDLLRIGPRRLRMDRKEALVERDQREAADKEKKVDAKLKSAAAIENRVQLDKERLLAKRDEFLAEKDEFLAEKSAAKTLGGQIGILAAAIQPAFSSMSDVITGQGRMITAQTEKLEREAAQLKKDYAKAQKDTAKKVDDALKSGMTLGEQKAAAKVDDMMQKSMRALADEQMNTLRAANKVTSLEAENAQMRHALEKIHGKNYNPGVDAGVSY